MYVVHVYSLCDSLSNGVLHKYHALALLAEICYLPNGALVGTDQHHEDLHVDEENIK